MLSLINHRYLIIQELGSGGMGTVYLVKDTLRNNQILALKTFYIDTLGEKSHAQFKSEFEVLAQLHHPNLVEVYDFGTISETQQYFFTMEYIPGETWQELASRQRTSASNDFYWLYPITLQVCRALQYIHSRGIIHYDIKPANIRVTPEGRVKLMDFGLNKRVDTPDTTTSLPRGTPAYVAPEVIRQELPDHRADLYALGVTLYEVTTGLLPYEGKMGMLGSQEKTVIFPEIPGRAIPPELKETILKLMSKAPADRYQSAGEIIQSMTRYIKVEHITPAIASYQDYVQNSSFIGRETELTYLQKHLAQMIQGKGHLLLITGEAGIGKTRLMREIRLRAQVQRVLVCEALCPEHVQSPYQPWITVFKQVMAQYRTTNPQILRQFAGAIIGLMPELIGALRAVPITGKIPQDKQLLINSATEFLLATNTPLLIILDNLHYADAETLTLLTNISTQIHKGRVLIVGLYRDAEIGKTHALHNLESRAPTHPACKLLQLGPLDNDAIRAVAASMLGIPLDKSAQGLPEGLLPWLVAQTGGNPLFIESLIYSLVELRCLYYDGHLWRLDRQKLPDTPLTIKQAAQQRLLKLNPTTLQFLQWAAVIGQQPNIDILQEVSQIPAQQLAEQISQATRHHVLVQAGESNQPRYRFSNDQMHQVIYDTLTPQERAKRHQRIGSALRNSYTENEILEQLAWHFEHAGELKDALQYAKKAGDKARRIYANESASQYYSKALELLHANQDNVTPEIHYDILSGRAEAYRLMGNRQAQHADLETMIRISAQMGDIARQIEAVNRLVELDNYLGNHTEARRKAEAGLELARQVHDEKLEAASLDALGEALFGLGEFETAYDVHEQALAICLILNDRKGEAHNLWHLGRIARVLGRLAQAQEHLKASLELHHALGDQPGENDALNELGNQTQDHQLRRDYYERSLEIAQRMGDKYRIGRAYNNLAITYLALGLYDRGRNYVEPAVEIQRETQDLSNLAYSLETLGRVYLELGTYEKANEVFQEGLVLSQDMGDRGVESVYWFNLGCVKLALGNTQEAEEYLLKAYTMQEEMGLLCYLYTTLAWLGMLYLEIGNWETAERYTARAVESLQVAGPGEYSPQEAWWLRYQVLKAMPPELQDNRSNDAMWTTLQNAHVTMMNGITTLRDEGLRRNYLNKVKVNRDIITEWARQLSKREQGTVLSKATAAVRQEADGDTEARVLKDRLKRVLNISVRMNETRDAASLLKFVMDQVIELSGAERGYLVLLNKSGEFEFKVAVGIDLEALEQHKAQISYTVLGTVAQSRAPVLLQDALTDERFGAQSSVLELNLRSVLCVPLISGADLTGMIYADNRSVSGRFSQADLDLMMIFANQAATAIENARLYEGLVNANQELETWAHTLEERVTQRTEELQAANTDLSRRAVQMQTSSQVSQQVTSILDLNTLLSRVVNLIQTQFGYYFAGVWLYDEAQAALILRAGTGEAGEKLIKQSFSIPLNASSIVASVCRDGNRRLVESVDEVPDFMWVEGLLDIASEVALPMRIGEHVLGVLDIASDHTAAFSSDDQLVLQSLADQIAVAIRNAQLYESEQTRRQLAELLERTGRALSSSMTYDEVPNLILELLHTLIPYERGLILLKKGAILKPVAHYGFPDERQATEMKIPINEGDVFRTLSSARHTLIIDDVTQEPGWTQMPWLPLNHSWLGIPMISRDDVIGMLSLTREDVGAFTPEDARLVEAFGTQAVIALENARLYSEIKGFNEKLEQMVKVRTAELNTAYKNLERLDKTKSDFINVAAHELRTPLTVVKGYTQLFKHYATYEKDPQLEKAMHGIVSGVDRLHEIINSMLDVAKIDSQTLKMFKERIEIADIVQRVCAGFTSILAERELVLSTDGLGKLPAVQADPDLLAKVFYQLIVNAIKYTPDGGEIKLAGHQGYDEDGQGYVEIVISDTGIGINPEDQELIFEKFYQTGEIEFHSSGRTKFKGGGPGLGLAIARGIIVAHQGRIWVESPGCNEEHCPGSQFHIRLPL